MLAECTPSFDLKDSWLLGICTVTGTSTVSLVTFKKSVLHVKCTWSRTMRDVTIASRSLNLTTGGLNAFAYASRRVNSFMLAGWPPIVVGRFVPSDRVNLSVFEASPICSIWLYPATGPWQ